MLRFGAGRVYSAALGAPYERCQDRWGAIFGDMGWAFLWFEVPRRRTLGQTGPLIEEDLVLSGKMSAGQNALVRACPSCPTAQKVPDFIGFLLVRFCPRACPGFCCFHRFLPQNRKSPDKCVCPVLFIYMAFVCFNVVPHVRRPTHHLSKCR
jgi:hypothetical protein